MNLITLAEEKLIYAMKPARMAWLKITLFVLFVVALLPFVYLVFFTFPLADDYCMAIKSEQLGAFGALQNWYMGWTGRYFSIFLLSISPGMYQNLLVYRLISLVLILLFASGLYLNIRGMLKSISRFDAAFVTSLFLFLLFYSMPSTSEGFYWLASSITHTFGSIMMLWLFPVLRWFDASQRAYWRPLVIASVLIITIVGSNEVIMVFLVGFLAAIVIYRGLKRAKPVWPWMLLLMVAMVSAGIVIGAPGNALRSDHFEGRGQLVHSILGVVSIVEYYIQTDYLRLVVYSLILVPVYSRYIQRGNLDGQRIPLYLHPVFAFVLWLAVPAILAFPSWWTIGTSGPPRLQNTIHLFFIVGWFYFLFTLVRYAITHVEFKIYTIPRVLGLLVLFFTVYSLGKSSNIRAAWGDALLGRAKGYAAEQHQRIKTIQECDQDTCRVMPFKQAAVSIFYRIEDLEHSKDDWKNKCYSAFHNKKAVVLAQPENLDQND